MRALKYVLCVMKKEENKAEWRRHCGELQAEGICCLEEAGQEQESNSGNTLVITDDEDMAEDCAQQGTACIGYCPPEEESFYFSHVHMVLESLEGIERGELERFFCRFHGLPVLIARTRRLRLRESMAEDFEALRRMEKEAGWNFDVTETREKYLSYLKYAYSFYGYGYWTAELLETGEIVGWCGFGGWGTQEENPDFIYMRIENPLIRPEAQRLELGYIVDTAYRRQGLALEMCRAALGYAFEALEAGAVWVRIERKNTASLHLAEKLGFAEVSLTNNC